MNVALVIIGNGRASYLRQAVVSATAYLPPSVTRIMVNDTGEADYAERLEQDYGRDYLVVNHKRNLGMAAAVNSGWEMAKLIGADYVFHLEEDFVLQAPVPITAMIDELERPREDKLASITLKRQPWAGIELVHGDQLAAICSLSSWKTAGPLTLHRHLFSLNPSLIPRSIIEDGWPSGPLGVGNESGMTDRLLADDYWFSVWGSFADPPLCLHIGSERGHEWQL